MAKRFVIIGGGPAGNQAATHAARLGAEVTLIERDIVGGAAHLWDCIPSKAMIATGGTLSMINEAKGMGLSDVSASLDFEALRRRIEAIEARLEQLAERGRTGVTALRTVLAERVGHLDAEVFEHRMAQLIEARSIPRPARQHRVDLNAAADGRNRFVLLDSAWARLRDDPDRVVGQIRAVLGGASCAPRN